MRGAGRKVEKRKNASLRENLDYNTGSWVETGRFVEYLPGYWLLSTSWPPLRVNPNPGKLSLGAWAALSSWLSVIPCVDMSLLPLKINTLPPRSSPPNGQPTATSEGWQHTHIYMHGLDINRVKVPLRREQRELYRYKEMERGKEKSLTVINWAIMAARPFTYVFFCSFFYFFYKFIFNLGSALSILISINTVYVMLSMGNICLNRKWNKVPSHGNRGKKY